jgi:chorismate--pyruvate lyase
MPVLNPQPDSAIDWFSEPGDAATHPGAKLYGWLTDTGLLTARLRRQCGANFRLTVIEDHVGAQPGSSTDKLRRIVLWCGDQPCIYAETLLPLTTTAEHPWLKELGDEPLGETLQTRSDVTRGSFEFALLTAAQLPADLPAQTDAALWARRSEFFVGNTSLLVTEVFLPGFVECVIQHMRPAD